MDLHFMWKTGESNIGNCPALYAAENGGKPGYVVQGKALDDDTRAALRDLGSDEDGVWVPADVLERLKAL